MSYQKIKHHFKRSDPLIFKVMRNLDFSQWLQPRQPKDYFLALCREIISQQLSGKASATILSRFHALFGKRKPTPQTLIKLSDQKLRNAGMSWAKASYVKNISRAFVEKKIDSRRLHQWSNEAVIDHLTEIKGIGRWTAEMFLIFTLSRENVFSFGDLGLRRALIKLYELENPSESQIRTIISPWSPYKSYGSIALWHSLE